MKRNIYFVSKAHLTGVLATFLIPSTDHGLFINFITIPIFLGTCCMRDVLQYCLAEFGGTTALI